MMVERGGQVEEPQDFAEFVALSSRDLLRSAWLLTGNWATAEDLVQTALAKCWSRWDHIVRRDAPEVYVRKVMVTTFLAWRGRRWSNELSTGRVPERSGSADMYTVVDTRAALVAAIATLPPKQRAVIVLRFFNDLTEAGTADMLGCSISTVKTHLARALRSLQSVPGLSHEITGEVV
jgi:RNA polymerase sigma-70 factor (sigma-E family)